MHLTKLIMKLIKDQDPRANRGRRSLLTATALVIAITLGLATGCTAGDGPTVKWRVSEADHSVSADEAKQQAEPVITAVANAISGIYPTAEWADELTVRTEERDRRCGIVVRKAGSFELDPLDMDLSRLNAAVADAAKPFGYTDLVVQGHGGARPQNELADVAANGTMLVLGHSMGENATIDVYIPAHHDQCA